MSTYLRAHFKKDEEERAVYCLMNTFDNDDPCEIPRSMSLIQIWMKEKKMDSNSQWKLKTWWELLDEQMIGKVKCSAIEEKTLFENYQQGNLSLSI